MGKARNGKLTGEPAKTDARGTSGGARAAADNGYRLWHIRLWHGMTTSRWVSAIARRNFRVSPKGVGLTLTVGGVSLVDSVLAGAQTALYDRKIRNTALDEPPIFIIGHWRSGTTHLHELLVRDERLGYPDTYECFAPSHALMSGPWLPSMLGWLVPAKRPMDNMAFGWRRPQEDEFALFAKGAESPYETILFPGDPPRDGETFQFSSPDAEQYWCDTLKWFLQSVQLRVGKRIVLKSPPHTARVGLLAKLFPGAKFIHILRDPYEVFPSTIRLWKTLWETQGLQSPNYDQLNDYVLGTFEQMYSRFEEQRGAIADGDYAEVRYHELVADPLGQLERLYSQLGLGDFSDARPNVEAYVDSLGDYRRNRHELEPEVAAEIARRWGPIMAPYGFQPASAGSSG